MKRIAMAASAIALVAGLAACTNPDGTADNRMTGAALGAVGGGLVGQAVGGDSRGALIGAAGGAAAGAALGNRRDAAQQPQTVDCRVRPDLCY
jgi:uncharacterized protein YcfJ